LTLPPSLALVHHYALALEQRCRPHLKICNASWNVDEMSSNVRTTWMDLSRAVDSPGKTLEFLLSSTRAAEAAKRFFLTALYASACSASQAPPIEEQVAQSAAEAAPNTTRLAPRVMNVEKHAASPQAIADLKASGRRPESVELRQVNYFNNLLEPDHRFLKRLVKPGMGFFCLETAWNT
jgi:transposase, IS6 family